MNRDSWEDYIQKEFDRHIKRVDFETYWIGPGGIMSALKVFFGLIVVLLCFSFVANAEAGTHLNKEAKYVDHYCTGKIEYRNSDNTRTDCLADDQSQEYDFANKWYECLTQAMHYGRLNMNSATCVLIVEKQSDLKYVDRANALVKDSCLQVKVITVGPIDDGM